MKTQWIGFTSIVLLLLTSCSGLSSEKKKDGFIIPDSDERELEPIEGTPNFRIINRSKETRIWYNEHEMTSINCVRNAKCQPLKTNNCLGSKLPYNYTSLHLTDMHSQDKAIEKLQQYAALKNIPKCWAVIQPFLCATFLPRCEEIHGKGMVHLPSIEMCRIVVEPCKIVYNTSIFPEFLKCNISLFPSKCDNSVREMKFNTSGQCLPPLVRTDIANHFYEDVSGCGLPCKDPLFTEDEHHQIKRMILLGGSFVLFSNVLTVTTFIIDWNAAKKYPALIIFYVNICYIMSSIGWLAQFIFDSKEDIVCSKDGTIRKGEPSAGENLSCVVIFVLVYYFLMAACVWFVIFTYVWNLGFKTLAFSGKSQENIDKKGAYFHIIAWSLPLILTITTLALSEIDGSSINGICFVGYINHAYRAGFLLGPLFTVLLLCEFFIFRILRTLIIVRTKSKEVISLRASRKIHSMIMRCSITAVLIFIIIFVTYICHIYEFNHSKEWKNSFRSFLICRLTSMFRGSDESECLQTYRPSVSMLQLQLLFWFFSALLMSSWTWTTASLETWKRYIRKKCGLKHEEPVKLQKHKLIAQAFAQRDEFDREGRLSLPFHNSYTDPVGLNFELNSEDSINFSSTWAKNLVRFIRRRDALTGVQNSRSVSSNAPRKNSQDSQISFSLRHISVESRRNSLDSQMSVKIAELKTKVASRKRVKSHYNHMSARKERKRERQTARFHLSGRERSRTESLDFMKRNRITSHLKKGDIDFLDRNGIPILPFLQNQGLTGDEDESSMASFKVRDNQLNIVLKKKNIHVSNEDLNSSNDGVDIIEYCSDSENERFVKNNKQVARRRESSTTTSGELGAAYKSRKDKFKDVSGSKSSSKSKSSRKSSRQSGRVRSKRLVKAYKHSNREMKCSYPKKKDALALVEANAMHNQSSSLNSDSSCSELMALGIQSSGFSGLSAGKNHSKGSKMSCDVGIQANLHEISTQMSRQHKYFEETKVEKMWMAKKENNRALTEKKIRIEQDEASDLLIKRSEKEVPSIVKKKIDDKLVEAKKLKQLLLP